MRASWSAFWEEDDSPPPPPKSDKAQLEELLYRLARLIGDKDEADAFWSAKVRGCADQVRAGQVSGLRNFLGLFGGMGSINDQPFSYVFRADLSRAYDLAKELLREAEKDSSRAAARKVVLHPWTEGHAGKAVVFGDGTVVATRDEAPNTPSIHDIKEASPPGPEAAIMAIAPDGACDVYTSNCDERWLVTQLQEYNPALHLAPPQG